MKEVRGKNILTYHSLVKNMDQDYLTVVIPHVPCFILC